MLLLKVGTCVVFDCIQVKLLEEMEHMDKETFDFKFGQELVYSTPLSDGRLVELIPGGGSVVVRYEDRMEFVRLVQKSRLEESREQVPHTYTHTI